MSTINHGGPAFPVVTRGNCEDGSNQFGHQFSHSTWQFPGMTLRDYFAAKAMQGLLAMERASEFVDEYGCEVGDEPGSVGTLFAHTQFLADEAYMIADMMLKAREATP